MQRSGAGVYAASVNKTDGKCNRAPSGERVVAGKRKRTMAGFPPLS